MKGNGLFGIRKFFEIIFGKDEELKKLRRDLEILFEKFVQSKNPSESLLIKKLIEFDVKNNGELQKALEEIC